MTAAAIALLLLLLAACGGRGECDRETRILPSPSLAASEAPIVTVECK